MDKGMTSTFADYRWQFYFEWVQKVQMDRLEAELKSRTLLNVHPW